MASMSMGGVVIYTVSDGIDVDGMNVDDDIVVGIMQGGEMVDVYMVD